MMSTLVISGEEAKALDCQSKDYRFKSTSYHSGKKNNFLLLAPYF